MPSLLEVEVLKGVKELNRRYPGNIDYVITDKQEVGSFVVYSVEFTDTTGHEKYTNFAVVRREKLLGAFYYLSDVIRFIDRQISWRSLLVDQFPTVVGSAVIIILVGVLAVRLCYRDEAPNSLWVAVSSGIGYLFGSKQRDRQATKKT